jgi:allantoin racemase
MSGHKTILVLNPNSNAIVTENMAEAIAGIDGSGEVSFLCETLESAPYGIESQADIDAIIEPVCQRIAEGDELASVIACYSDPGLAELREITEKPVFAIQESGIHVATTQHESFGVIALSEASKSRHLVYIEKLGQSDRLAGERVADLTVAESASGEQTFAKLLYAGQLLRDHDKADVIILGCAGMARHRAPLEKALGITVIDPVQAAAQRALNAVT